MTHRGTAAERSASGSMIVPELFPSSIVTFFRPAFRMIASPTGGDPVKETLAIRGSTVSHSPTVPPDPTTTLKAPAGIPASSRISASRMAVSGVVEAGFSTIVFPTASAGPTLWATRFSGKLNGVMAETTPKRLRSQNPTRPSPAKLASIGTVSPWIRLASSAENRYVSIDRETSPMEYFHAFPASRQMIVATSSCRLSRSWEALFRIWYLLWAGVRDQDGKAECAAPIARSTASRDATGTNPIVSPVYLSMTDMVSFPSTHFPPTNSRYVFVAAFPIGFVPPVGIVSEFHRRADRAQRPLRVRHVRL